MSSLKRTAPTEPISKRRTKKSKVEALPPFPFFEPDFKDIAGVLVSHVPTRDLVSLSLTCKSGLHFLPKKELFPKRYEMYESETNKEDFEARSYDTLFINDAIFPGEEIINKKFGKVKRAILNMDRLKYGIGCLSPIGKICDYLPNLEILEIKASYPLNVAGLKKSIRKLRIRSDNENMISKHHIYITLNHELEELYVSGHKETPVSLEYTEIKKIHGQCKLTRTQKKQIVTDLVNDQVIHF